MKAIFEIQREANSTTIWEAGVGHRVVYPSEVFAIAQTDILETDERRFHNAKEHTGVAVIEKFGELVSPYEYLQRLFKSYRSKVGQSMGIIVYENLLVRPASEYW